MPRPPRKPAPRKAVRAHPRNSSTGVQKPPRTTNANALVPAAAIRRKRPTGRLVPLDQLMGAPVAPVVREAPAPVLLAPFLTSIDWLTLNMDVPPYRPQSPLPWQVAEPRRWWLEMNAERVYWTRPTTRRTQQFNRVTEVVDELERKVMTIWSDPHDCKLHADTWIQVQFANHTFERGEWATLLNMLKDRGCTLRGISRVDIACDGIEGDGGDWPKVIDLTRNGNVRAYTKCDWLVRHSRGKTVGGEFGHRGSNKFIRAYRKCREMKRKGIKEHIVNQWQAALGFNPMDTGHKVNRFEVQLKGKEIRRYFPDEKGPRAMDFVLSLADPAIRVDVFASMAVGMFDFRTRATRAREAVPVMAWDWSRVVKHEPAIAFRASRNVAITEYTMKTELRALFRVAVTLSDENVMEVARRNAEAYSPAMVAWFEKKRVMWTKEYGKLIRAGDLRTLEYFAALAEPEPDPMEIPLMTREEWENQDRWERLPASPERYGPEPPAPFDEPPPPDDDVNPW
jgi:predicted ester cyclase